MGFPLERMPGVVKYGIKGILHDAIIEMRVKFYVGQSAYPSGEVDECRCRR
jgi:hypothetical protein